MSGYAVVIGIMLITFAALAFVLMQDESATSEEDQVEREHFEDEPFGEPDTGDSGPPERRIFETPGNDLDWST